MQTLTKSKPVCPLTQINLKKKHSKSKPKSKSKVCRLSGKKIKIHANSTHTQNQNLSLTSAKKVKKKIKHAKHYESPNQCQLTDKKTNTLKNNHKVKSLSAHKWRKKHKNKNMQTTLTRSVRSKLEKSACFLKMFLF